MSKILSVFDFDGTLFRSPADTAESRSKYEKEVKTPWDKAGWYGRRETLEPPLVPDPAPKEMFIKEVCQSLLENKRNPDVIAVLLTGRHGGMKHQVLRICHDGDLIDVQRKPSEKGLFFEIIDPNIQCYFKGDNGLLPNAKKPGETLPWKIWIMKQFLVLFPELEKVEIWEDRIKHVEKFKTLNEIWKQEVIVNHVS